MRAVVFLMLVAGCSDFDALDSRAMHDDQPDLALPSDLATVDLQTAPDLGPSCTNGVTDGDETDVDCGGSCGACALDLTCAASTDCKSGFCDEHRCTPATSPPFWLALTVSGGTPRPRYGLSMVAVDGKLYAMGGYDTDLLNTVESYDPDSNLWSTPATMGQQRFTLATAVLDATIYAFGGLKSGASGTAERAFPGLGWSNIALGVVGGGYQAVTVGRIMYLLGGSYGAGTQAAVLAFDGTATSTNFDASSPSMLHKRYLPGADQLGGRIYVAGGNDGTTATNTVESWTPGDKMWAAETPMHQNRQWHNLVAAPDGRLYAIGGADPAGGFLYRSVEAYRGKTWQTVAAMVVTREAAAAAVGADGRIYALGGANLLGFSAGIEAYGPVFTVTPATAKAGQSVMIAGSNFAASARVDVSFAGGSVVATGTTDGSGTLMPISVTVPASLMSGAVRISAVDDKSGYPVSRPFTVQ